MYHEWVEEDCIHVIGGKETTVSPRHWQVDNIKMDLGKTGWGGVDQIGLAQETSGDLQ
jgi:hypothetical protein